MKMLYQLSKQKYPAEFIFFVIKNGDYLKLVMGSKKFSSGN